MMKYHQLTKDERSQIYALKKADQDQQTDCHQDRSSTLDHWVTRLLSASSGIGTLWSQSKVATMRPVVVAQIEAYLRQEWNPEPIAGRLAICHRLQLAVERIYQNILADL